jgi:hypothetical protein
MSQALIKEAEALDEDDSFRIYLGIALGFSEELQQEVKWRNRKKQ